MIIIVIATYVDDISDDEVIDFDRSELALSQDKALGGDQILEGLHDFRGFGLLVVAENSRHDHDGR